MTDFLYGLCQSKNKNESAARKRFLKARQTFATITEAVESMVRSNQHQRDQRHKQTKREWKKNPKQTSQQKTREQTKRERKKNPKQTSQHKTGEQTKREQKQNRKQTPQHKKVEQTKREPKKNSKRKSQQQTGDIAIRREMANREKRWKETKRNQKKKNSKFDMARRLFEGGSAPPSPTSYLGPSNRVEKKKMPQEKKKSKRIKKNQEDQDESKYLQFTLKSGGIIEKSEPSVAIQTDENFSGNYKTTRREGKDIPRQQDGRTTKWKQQPEWTPVRRSSKIDTVKSLFEDGSSAPTHELHIVEEFVEEVIEDDIIEYSEGIPNEIPRFLTDIPEEVAGYSEEETEFDSDEDEEVFSLDIDPEKDTRHRCTGSVSSLSLSSASSHSLDMDSFIHPISSFTLSKAVKNEVYFQDDREDDSEDDDDDDDIHMMQNGALKWMQNGQNVQTDPLSSSTHTHSTASSTMSKFDLARSIFESGASVVSSVTCDDDLFLGDHYEEKQWRQTERNKVKNKFDMSGGLFGTICGDPPRSTPPLQPTRTNSFRKEKLRNDKHHLRLAKDFIEKRSNSSAFEKAKKMFSGGNQGRSASSENGGSLWKGNRGRTASSGSEGSLWEEVTYVDDMEISEEIAAEITDYSDEYIDEIIDMDEYEDWEIEIVED